MRHAMSGRLLCCVDCLFLLDLSHSRRAGLWLNHVSDSLRIRRDGYPTKRRAVSHLTGPRLPKETKNPEHSLEGRERSKSALLPGGPTGTHVKHAEALYKDQVISVPLIGPRPKVTADTMPEAEINIYR
jgi:hypothetical protein